VKKEVEKTVTVDEYFCDGCQCRMDSDIPSDTVEIAVCEFRNMVGTITVVHNLCAKDTDRQADICEKCLVDTVAYVGRNLGENGG
jgi:hypothetical protein